MTGGSRDHAARDRVRPDPAHGYCVDDVARALQVDLLHGRTLGWAAVARERLAQDFRFLCDAFDASSGRFRNFRSIDGSWIGGPGSDDSYGRAMLSLGDTIATAARRAAGRRRNCSLRSRAPGGPRADLAAGGGVGRPWAAAAIRDPAPSELPRAMLELLATRLHDRFRGFNARLAVAGTDR